MGEALLTQQNGGRYAAAAVVVFGPVQVFTGSHWKDICNMGSKTIAGTCSRDREMK